MAGGMNMNLSEVRRIVGELQKEKGLLDAAKGQWASRGGTDNPREIGFDGKAHQFGKADLSEAKFLSHRSGEILKMVRDAATAYDRLLHSLTQRLGTAVSAYEGSDDRADGRLRTPQTPPPGGVV